MNEFDENGWAHVHHAAYRGFVKSVERFVKANTEQLELETEDDLRVTPLLLAVMSGIKETVECLVDLGAKVWVVNSQNHGVIELCAFKQFIELLEYFIELNHEKLPVWKNLIKFMGSVIDEEAEAAAKCLRTLTMRSNNEINPNWKPAYDNAVVPAIVKVLKSQIGDQAKIAVLHVLLNFISEPEVKQQTSSTGGIPSLVRNLNKSSPNYLIQLSAEVLKELCTVEEYADTVAQNGAIPALVKVLQNVNAPEVLVPVSDCLGNLSEANERHQQTIGTTPGVFKAYVDLFEDISNKPLQMALTKGVSKISRRHVSNQIAFINEGVAAKIITLIRMDGKRHLELQLNAVEAINRLAEDNPTTQIAIVDSGIVNPLLRLLKRSRAQDVQETAAGALWSLAGSDTEMRRQMAEQMGVQLLIEFLSSLSEDLHYIGSEGLGVLAQGPRSKQSEIATTNGVHPLVRLLRSDKEHIVLSVVRTLRHLTVGVGYIPHPGNQKAISQSRGIKYLVALMVHSRNELIQVESAHTLGCCALGNSDNLDEIQQNMDFSYVRILKMMYATDDMVRLLAGAALSAFAYNSVSNQREIAEQGGVRFSCFVPFLQSEDELYRCNAAFQVVVLARIIPDEEQAISSAAGIKLLVDLLQDSKSPDILTLASDCLARLAHTRAGVPSAFVSIRAVELLCDHLTHEAEYVRGNAAIALSYLSFNHDAKRKLLNRCRVNPVYMKIIRLFVSKLNDDFLEGWKHYKTIGLPKIDEGPLVNKKTVSLADRPQTEEDGTGSSNMRSLETGSNFNSGGLNDSEEKGSRVTGRSSRSTNLTTTPRESQRSVVGSHIGSLGPPRSRQGSMMSQELPVEIMADT